MNNSSGYIKEIFPSIQGEGKYVGAKQLFVRLAGCSINCLNCDTDYSAEDFFIINDKRIQNPVSPVDLAGNITEAFGLNSFHSISITGGEPLDQFGFLKDFIKAVKEMSGIRIFLETSGFYSDKLLALQDIVDIFSIDLKIKSSFGVNNLQSVQKIMRSIDTSKTYVKLIINKNISETEIDSVLKVLMDSKMKEIYLQPLNNISYNNELEHIIELLQKNKIDAYFIPQIQKFMEIR
ncbi:Radical SAM domain protein [Flexistipes sinusarabici DSM 4947]|uniref:7-carboxy-7-deazaguanine synthase n=1 Tax=Flexistipes sinusarabici (strain ATCC 49648 / DSM 4947 / MAS 10) TaxID=717231 RepID=F8E703_FLESM|nr:7-carboxy-7-deazaguanine synthase QueE [Flexistipes sinusarabici]AEI14866.1 Radical SAM domain protein [Flexistipes sinusarabici DSM 4947]